jgi:hypothetical protein
VKIERKKSNTGFRDAMAEARRAMGYPCDLHAVAYLLGEAVQDTARISGPHECGCGEDCPCRLGQSTSGRARSASTPSATFRRTGERTSTV